MKQLSEYLNEVNLNESSTDDAAKSLDAIIKFLKKQDNPSDSAKEMLKMGAGIKSYYDKKKSFAPDQAKWIFSTSKALFK